MPGPDRAYNKDMTNTEAAAALEISDRRMNYLAGRGEDARKTIAWQDACDERAQLERSIAFSNWKAAGCPIYRGRIVK